MFSMGLTFVLESTFFVCGCIVGIIVLGVELSLFGVVWLELFGFGFVEGFFVHGFGFVEGRHDS